MLLVGIAGALAGLVAPSAAQVEVSAEVRDTPVEAEGPRLPLMEPRPAVHPGDPANAVVAAITRGPDGSPWHCVAHRTDDGGRSWSRHDFREMEGCVDPWVLILEDGTVLLTAIEIRSDAEGDERFNLLLFRSGDGGMTWQEPAELGRTHEHAMLVAGRGRPGEPGPPPIYLASRITAATLAGSSRHAIHLSRSLDGGRSFVERFRLIPGVRSVMPTAVVPMGDGRLAVSYRISNRDMATGEEGTLPTTPAWLLDLPEDGDGALRHRKITDGCSTGALEQAFTGYPYMAGGPGPEGRTHLYHACIRPGLQGVAVARSEDGGATWGDARSVDGLDEMSDAHARTPMVAVNGAGMVGVAWYDRRHDPDRACQDVYFTASADGGRSFSRPFRVTTETSCPGVEGNGSAGRAWPMGGDYSSLTTSPDGAFHLVWADSRSGRFRLRRAVLRVGERGG